MLTSVHRPSCSNDWSRMICSASAPYSDRVRAAVEPAMTWVSARTLIPESGCTGSGVQPTGSVSPILRISIRSVSAR